ncbi:MULTISPECIES: ATP-binding protein [Pacificibacter]|uniref:ATP-binding protein n=1 Tax=Pacificibacter TaxID=1042323 RepID=UPI0020910970|nr:MULTISPECIES: ATP-binding protein [Pacificibacter]MDO6617106.1 ATP-binding protein [Pacificibacter sp. 1_MG-2023]
MPRGLYGRAVLILLVPIVVLQLVVLVAFSQRYFSDITDQLMRGVRADVSFYVDALQNVPDQDLPEVLLGLDKRLEFETRVIDDGASVVDQRAWYDFSGILITRILYERVQGIEGVDLKSSMRRVIIGMRLNGQHIEIKVPRERASAKNPHQLILVTLLTSIVMAIVAATFLRNQLRPIRRLARAAEAFGRGRNVPYKLAGALEVRAAGAAFVDMRARIERHIEQRTLILSGVSHDLRTPLTRMRLSLSLLDADPNQADDIDALQEDLSEMERLLDEFLAFTRADALDEPQKVDPVSILLGAFERSKRAGGAITCDQLEQGKYVISARPDALARALDNLISNALRYGTSAHVSLTIHERSVVFCVEDDGPGIDVADRGKVLQPFVRLDAARNQNRGSGVGLGLAIATDIARKHGGSLRLGHSSELGGLKAEIVIAR